MSSVSASAASAAGANCAFVKSVSGGGGGASGARSRARAREASRAASAASALKRAAGTNGFRAAWVCSILNLDFPSKPGLGNAELKKEIDAIVDRAAELKLNALILQVRPSGDALYKSSLFPWSEYLTGTQGASPAGGFDPLAYWVEQTHKKGLELHAWVNPYRVSHTSSGLTSVKDAGKLAADNPARKDPSRIVAYNGALYYDPGIYANKKLVINGVAEIIRNYDVDGVHLDDYFYPGTDFPDDASYGKYGRGIDKADWRRANVNDVIKGIQRIIKRQKKDIKFGVSPFAIWMNASSNPLGSDTRGSESYKTMYADTRRWVKSGWID
jgi:uncharacterized lipoprotein YddW (UPF0748 family)